MAPKDINAGSSQTEKRSNSEYRWQVLEEYPLWGCSACCTGPLGNSFGSAIPIIPPPGLLQFWSILLQELSSAKRGLLCPRLCFFLRENLYWILFCDLLTQLDWLRVLFIRTTFQPLLLTILLPPSLTCSSAESRPNKPRTERYPS